MPDCFWRENWGFLCGGGGGEGEVVALVHDAVPVHVVGHVVDVAFVVLLSARLDVTHVVVTFSVPQTLGFADKDHDDDCDEKKMQMMTMTM